MNFLKKSLDEFSQSIELPSNKKFGLFLIFLSCLMFTFSIIIENKIYFYTSIILISFLVPISLFFSKALTLPLKYWLLFGFMLGKIFNPLLIGIIYFLIITPIGMINRNFLSKDELRLKKNKISDTYWNEIQENGRKNDFNKQY